MTRESPDHVTCKHCGKKFRAITTSHLRTHGYDDEHPVLAYKSEFDLRYAMCRDSRQRMSDARVSFWDDRGQHWTKARLLAEIRRVRRSRGSLRPRDIPARVLLAARRLFGSWEAAIQTIGLNYEEASGIHHWNRDKVVEWIQKIAASGEPLHTTYIKEHYFFLYRAAVRYFPSSWEKALCAAGIGNGAHKKPRQPWTRETAETWVKTALRKKQSIVARDVPRDLLRFVYRHLGIGWGEFVGSLGIRYPGMNLCRDWTKDRVLEEMHRWKSEGHPMTCIAVLEANHTLVHQARKFFGTWAAARVGAEM